MKPIRILFLAFIFINSNTSGQKLRDESKGIYIDKQGVMRWTSNNEEAAFFGVNYTVPFAYGYRSHKALGVDLEKAIRQDVYHLSRLGLDAFRVHVWDTEITDSAGNLLNNDHLRLYDFLLAELKKYKIKTILTPIAFWGNGYPERDTKTPGFSSRYPKRVALVNDTAIAAQENYLRQLTEHVNPYTKMKYKDDPDVIAAEINNEPHHSGPKEKVTAYINRMVNAMRSKGWTKPIFYNISESPAYADAVSRANIQGVSFQWYPTGLVANRSQRGNFLPHVDLYRIPFGDTIPQYRNKARMVYEFDAADVPGSYMYPAMARSYRTAGFQWATQFAYDPMATAYGNTEYQTHYLNLAYTPSKAISLLIASRVFHKIPRLKSYGTYPADTIFDVFRVSYAHDLSEMNSEKEFYYSNSTSTKPVDPANLKHIAGVGNSPVVQYRGSGAYFLDKQESGEWLLEIMPDAIPVKDPFERASPRKEMVLIAWREQRMQLFLPGLENNFHIMALDSAQKGKTKMVGQASFWIGPGLYLLKPSGSLANVSVLPAATNYHAPPTSVRGAVVAHVPPHQLLPGKPATVRFTVAGAGADNKLSVEFRHSAIQQWKNVEPAFESPYDFVASVPNEMLVPGQLNYRLIIRDGSSEVTAFPGNHKSPYAWDNYVNETWETMIVPPLSPLELFDAAKDRTSLVIYNPDWRMNSIQYVTSEHSGALAMKASLGRPGEGRFMGWQLYVGNKIDARGEFAGILGELVLKARAMGPEPVQLRVALITRNGSSFATIVEIKNQYDEIKIPLRDLKPDSSLLLPRPYPGFHPLWFKPAAIAAFALRDVERLEVSFGHVAASAFSIEIEKLWLRK